MQKRILMIDDDQAFGSLVSDMLEDTPCQLEFTSDYREGLRLAMSNPPDLIMLDIHMPEVSGLDLIRQLRHMQLTRNVPVLMLTGDDRLESVETAKKYEAVGYLLKPFKPSLLFQTLSQVLGIELVSPLRQQKLESAAAPPVAKPVLPSIKTKTLLIIDDEPPMINLISEILADSILQVMSATEPREGLRLAMTYHVDLILTDVNMPEITGLELTEQLKKMQATHQIPVIVMSGESESSLAEKARQMGAAAFLAKPFRPLGLIRALQQALGKDIF